MRGSTRSGSALPSAAGSEPHVSIPDRNGAIDLLRFLGAIGIIWFHMGAPGGELTLAALPMFVALTVYFGLRSGMSMPLRDLARRRAQRLLVPWVFWSVVYAVAKTAEAVVAGRPLSTEFHIHMLLTGPQIHLWFLPFAYAAVVASRALLGVTPRLVAGTAWLMLGFIVISATALLLFDAAGPGPPFGQWLTALPAVLLGVLLVRADEDRQVLWLAFLCSATVFVLLGPFGAQVHATPTLLASLLLLCSFVLFFPSSWWTIRLSQLALGIYLVHPLVVAVVKRLPSVPSDAPGEAVVVTVLSIAATVVLRQMPVLRGVV